MGELINIVGQKYERLTVLGRALTPPGYTKAHWKCLCLCGKEIVVAGSSLRNGNTKSCGCLSGDMTALRNRTHGLAHIPEYNIWKGIKARCHNKMQPGYSDYGGRGISVCAEWLHSFGRFYADMGPRPTADHQIDREDNDGDYEPDNCWWVTCAVNSRNRRSTRLNPQAVVAIRYLCNEKGFLYERVANAYGIHKSTIGNVARMETWV